jgi:hypothetical protein
MPVVALDPLRVTVSELRGDDEQRHALHDEPGGMPLLCRSRSWQAR